MKIMPVSTSGAITWASCTAPLGIRIWDKPRRAQTCSSTS
jgi:hypothetical protein